jgi:DNA-binding HxlR family transcriptional regulator
LTVIYLRIKVVYNQIKHEWKNMSVKYLKVKIKTLTAEARIIRGEEYKAKKRRTWASVRQGREEQARIAYEEFWGLRDHRTGVVRKEARSSLLAYGYIRGRKYLEVETISKSFQNLERYSLETIKGLVREQVEPYLPRMVKMVSKYGALEVSIQDILAWATDWNEEDLKALKLKDEEEATKRKLKAKNSSKDRTSWA